jgi:hypothetical protein
MKLSELRPCDVCGGKLAPSFYVLRMSIALISPTPTNQVLGLAQYFQGNLGLAEVFAPESDQAVVVAMDEKEHTGLMQEFFVCTTCYMAPICLAELVEKRNPSVD